jgi:hypothetical protein
MKKRHLPEETIIFSVLEKQSWSDMSFPQSSQNVFTVITSTPYVLSANSANPADILLFPRHAPFCCSSSA